MIDAIVREPDVDGNWLIYADWLCERGDPRGELISLGLAAPSDEVKSRARELEADEERLITPRLAEQAHLWRFTWWRGFIHGAQLAGAKDEQPTPETVLALMADPHAVLIDWLTLQWRADDELVAALTAEPHRNVRTLRMSGRVTRADLARGLPALTCLHVDGGGGPRSLVHPQLRELHATCEALGTGRFELPRLENLQTYARADDPLFGPTSILASPPPRLRGLSLQTRDTIERLLEMPVVAQLHALQLGGISLHDVDRLCARPPIHLRRLKLTPSRGEGEELLAPSAVDALAARLAAAFPNTEIEAEWWMIQRKGDA